jgi:NAD(P)-dependent dehydrogenase (short-subunit alcohol dehydrogenase family)
MKTAIVTGAAGNLGSAVVTKFLSEGYHVTGALSPRDKQDAKQDRYDTQVVDLMDEAASQSFVSAVISKHDHIDVAVLTVGGFAMAGIADTKTADIAFQYKLNFETAYNVARPVFVQMLKQGSGRIFLIGSRPGLDMHTSKGMVAYGLGKSLIFRLAELMNDEAKGKNVVTNVVIPSTIDTPQNRQNMPDADYSKWVTPEAIADTIHYYTTGIAEILRESLIKVYNKA